MIRAEILLQVLEVVRVRGPSGARVARLGLGENPYESQRARDQLGWRPPVTHESALGRTGRWLLAATTNEVTES